MGIGIGHLIIILAYVGFWVMSILALGGKPLWGLYYLTPFVPYRTFRDHFIDYPMGENVFTVLILAVIIGAIFQGKRLPKSSLHWVWLAFFIYLYFSMWFGVALVGAPAPLWLSDINFVTWKDYLVIPLLFVGAGMVIEDRKAIRTIILITAVTLLLIDRSCLLESMSRTWTNFDESKRSGGPLAFGSNQTAAFLVQMGMFYWGFLQFVKSKKWKLFGYALVAATVSAAMYTFSRAGYIALIVGVLLLGILKDRKLLFFLVIFLFSWQAIVPNSVRERVTMTKSEDGQLEASAQERIDLWNESWTSITSSPILGNGYATFQLMKHADGLEDTHNWYVLVLVETGFVGLVFVVVLLGQAISVSYRLFRSGTDPIFQGLGFGLLLTMCACLITNFFGNRWTYVEITGPLWILLGAATRADELSQQTLQPALGTTAGSRGDSGFARRRMTPSPQYGSGVARR